MMETNEQIPSKEQPEEQKIDERHMKATEQYIKVKQWQKQIIDEAIKSGTVIQVEKLFEPEQRYMMVARQLNVERDRVKAFAILNEMVQREIGAYHINGNGPKVFQNTTNAKLLVIMIYTRLVDILNKTPERGPMALLYLEQWKDQPTHNDKLTIPDEIKTARVIKSIEQAIARGMIENTPEGLKWRGIGLAGTQMQLAYFCKCAWCPNNTEKLPETAINNLFNVKRIGSYVNRLFDAKKPQKWRAQIDELFME